MSVTQHHMSPYNMDTDNVFRQLFGILPEVRENVRDSRHVGRRARPRAVVPQFTVDFRESDDRYDVFADLPGMDRSNVKVTVEDGNLRVCAERTDTREENNEDTTSGTYSFSERRYGRFERVFTLPEDVNEETVEARYDNGVLHVTLPRTERTTRGRTVEVK